MAVMKTAVLLACLAAALAGPPTPRTPKTPTRTPVTPSTADSGRLPDDILCMVYGGDDCRKGNTTLHRRRRQDDGAGGANADPATAGLDPEQLCSIFGGPNCPPDQSKTHEPCDCPNASSSGCECVPYYQCDSQSGEYNQDGVGLIDIRQQNKCGHYLQQCCKVRQGGHPDPDPVNPGPTNPDPVNPDPVNPDPVNPGPTNPDYPGTPNVPAPLTNKPPCGVRHRGGIGSRISGFDNDEAQFGELPWMVAVFRTRETDLEYLCGGGLIAANVVLTAAHCFRDSMEASNLAIRAGEWDSRTEDEAYKHQDRLVDQLIVHPDYKDRALHNDVALLVLREPIKLGYHISTICLPEQGQTFDRSECLVSGWGKNKFDKDGEYANILRRIDDLPVVPHDQCQDSLRTAGGGRLGAYFKLHKSFMCAGGVKGKDACTGDGGSPLVCPTSDDDDARYAFAGVVSWGIGCGYEGVPGVYANVALFRRWIEDTLANINIEVTDP